MNEAGTRVPLIVHWPGRVPAGTRMEFFTLMDVLPTIASLAGIAVDHQIDGMDLSHNFLRKPGKDRERVFMAFEGEIFFVRDRRFRLHEDGRFYDVSVSSNESRYSMETLSRDLHSERRRGLQRYLDEFIRIRQTDASYEIIPFGTNGDQFKNEQDRKARGNERL